MSDEPRIVSIDLTHLVVAALAQERDEDNEASGTSGRDSADWGPDHAPLCMWLGMGRDPCSGADSDGPAARFTPQTRHGPKRADQTQARAAHHSRRRFSASASPSTPSSRRRSSRKR